MKKIIQFLVLTVILGSCFSSQAGTIKGIEYPKEASTVRTSFTKAAPKLGGEMLAIITVLDFNNHPIQGATVSAPCTGLANKLTDSHGVATFNMGTVCSCSEDNCTVTTPKGACYQVIKISCGTYTVNCNQ